MKIHSIAIASLVCTLACAAHAATPAGQITQLQGFVMAVKPGGGLKLLSSQSTIEVGDTLMSEQGSFVRVDLADGRAAVLGPQTRLQVVAADKFELKNGQLRVIASTKPNAGALTIVTGGGTIDAGNGTFDARFEPDPANPVGRTGPAATRARLGALGAAPAETPSSPASVVAVTFIVNYTPPLPTGGSGITPPVPGVPPGLHLSVQDGAINVSNPGGSQGFAAGQFGYVPSQTQPPVVVPSNPGIQFTPPPAFNSSSTPGPNGTSKSNAVDCVVR